MKLFTRNVLLATLVFMAVNAGKAAVVDVTPPEEASALAVYLGTLFVLSLGYAWVFKFVWLKLDEHLESEGEEYEPNEWSRD